MTMDLYWSPYCLFN